MKAKISDFIEIYSLLQDFKLPTEGITLHFDNFFIIKNCDNLIGVGGIEIYGCTGLLRSIAINQEYQGRGLNVQPFGGFWLRSQFFHEG